MDRLAGALFFLLPCSAWAAPHAWGAKGEKSVLLGTAAGYETRLARNHTFSIGATPRLRKRYANWRKVKNYQICAFFHFTHAIDIENYTQLYWGYGPTLWWKVIDLKAFLGVDFRLLGRVSLSMKGGGKLPLWQSRGKLRPFWDVIVKLPIN